MNSDIVGQATNLFTLYVVPLGWKLGGALAVWIVGGWVIRLLRAAIERTMRAKKVEPTLAGYIEASANVLLKLLLFIAVLSVLGIETTSLYKWIKAGIIPPPIKTGPRGFTSRWDVADLRACRDKLRGGAA